MSNSITIFMCGDVMTGRGIDQILPHPGDPMLYEPYVRDARKYVAFAEGINGHIKKPVGFSYIWGDSLAELERLNPHVRIINLETAITRSEDYMSKGINYRMNPENIPCLTAAKVQVCSLANNHMLDWGNSGLLDTLETLDKAGIRHAGAGRNIEEAEAPAIVEINGKGRVIVFSFGSLTSGIPVDWGATVVKGGVNLLNDLSKKTILRIKDKVYKIKRHGDIVVASIHWGENWGYDVPHEQREFARRLIDDAGMDIIHGHSSHHVKGIEVYKGKPVIYGCGDFINDYEGISGYEEFRGDLTLMYFAEIDPPAGNLVSLRMAPMNIRRFRLNKASKEDAAWLRDVLNREGSGTNVELEKNNTLSLQWQ